MFIRLLRAVGARPHGQLASEVAGPVATGVPARPVRAERLLVAPDAVAEAVWDEPSDYARDAVQAAVFNPRRAVRAGADRELPQRSHAAAAPTHRYPDMTRSPT